MQTLIIDIRPLLPKHLPGGVPEYTRQLLLALLPLLVKKPHVRLVLFSSGRQEPDLELFSPWRKVFYHYYLRLPNKLLNASFKLLAWPRLDILVKKAFDIPVSELVTVFAPNINLLPVSSQARLVVTFHDLSFERYPFFLKRKDALWHRLVNPRRLAKRADAIIAVSESTKQDLLSMYKVQPKSVSVIYSGIAKEFVLKREVSSNNLKTILYFGSSEGRKNVSALVSAYATLKHSLKNAKLILAGPPYRSVSREERPVLYQSASLFVYPSFFEGFGLPPVEAMALGVPVVTSCASSLPEAVGNAALSVNPHRVPELVEAMKSLLTDERLHDHFLKKGLQQAQKFNWENAAQKTLDILF